MLKELFSFKDRYRILHFTWFAFFLTFVCWFSFAPFATTIGKELSLSDPQIKTLGICNIALTIPARIIIGMLLDRFGPRITYAAPADLCCFTLFDDSNRARLQSIGLEPSVDGYSWFRVCGGHSDGI